MDEGFSNVFLVSSSLTCLIPPILEKHGTHVSICRFSNLISSDHEYNFTFFFLQTQRGPLWKQGHFVPTFVSCHIILGLYFICIYILVFYFICSLLLVILHIVMYYFDFTFILAKYTYLLT